MPRVTHVKSARKANKDYGIKKGESYYWWKFRFGGKRVSKTPPKRSQLTQSAFWGTVFDLQDSAALSPCFDDLEAEISNLTGELQSLHDECEQSLENIPEQLREASAGSMLQERIECLEEVISELESIDVSFDEPDIDTDETEEAFNERFSKEREERADEIWQEVTDALGNIGCS